MSREMIDSGIEWIAEIPEGWEIVRLKHVCDIVMGQSPNSDGYNIEGIGVPFLQGNADFTGKYPLERIHCDNANKFSQPLDILFSVRAPVGAKNISDKVYAIGRGLCAITPKKVNRCMMWYLIDIINQEFNFTAKGSTYDSVAISDVNNAKIPIPPDSEQQKIADYLEQKVSEIDNIITQTTLSIEEYKKYKLSFITEAVSKGLNTDVEMRDSGVEHIGFKPINWKVIKLKYILEERNIKSSTGTEEPLSMSQKYGLIKTKDMEMIPNIASSFIGNKYVKINDLVFNKLKAHLGVFGVSSYEGLVSPDYAVYYSKGNVNVKFLEFLFKTRIYINEFKKYSKGVGEGLTRLYTNDLFNIKCAIPSMEQQNKIADYLRKKCMDIDNLISQKVQLLTELQNYKKSIIYECVTGKREVG